jgi:hypothetical protein
MNLLHCEIKQIINLSQSISLLIIEICFKSHPQRTTADSQNNSI